MLRRDRQLRIKIFQCVDMALYAIALWLAHAVRAHWQHFYFFGFDVFGRPVGEFSVEYFSLFLVLIPGAFVVLERQGFYDRPLFAPRQQTAVILAKSGVICATGLVFIQYMLMRSGARGVFVLFAFISFALMFLKEELIRSIYKSKLGQAQYRKRVILVGAMEDTRRLRTHIGRNQDELEIVGEFDLGQTPIEQLVAFLHTHSINTVIFNARHTLFGNVEKAIQACELEGIEAWLVADFFQTSISRTSLDDFFGQPVLVFHSGPQNPWPRLIKLLVDYLGALVLLVPGSFVMLGAAIMIKLTSPGPILFRQQRSGINGKPFTMYKFRTMGTDAEQLKQELAQLNEMSGPVFKITNDPRVTKVGRWLRKKSIDEFPQLFNVLRGEMSLVGPRPLPVDEVNRFDDPAHRRRLSVKPGLTCLWQVSGRNNVSDFKEWVRLDLEYIDNWSLSLDFSILLRTIPVVLFWQGRELNNPHDRREKIGSNTCMAKSKQSGKSGQPTSVVTGGAGFLGSHLVDYLLARGHKVVAIDNFVTGSVDNIAHLAGNKNFKFIEQDVTEFLFLDIPVNYVWHFASPASPIDYLEIPIQTLKVGSLGTHKALGLAMNKNARFLIASTSEVYGDPLIHPQPESYWGNVNTIGPRGCYDESKRFAEAMTMAYHREHKVDTRIVRIFNTYGPRMRLNDGRVVPAFISQALKGKPVTVFGKGDQTRSFCYCSDLIEGIYRLMMSDTHEPVNIGNPTEMTMLQFAHEIIRATGSKSKIVFKPLPQDDPRQRKPDITRARKLLGWEPRVKLAEGIDRTIEYFRKKV